jgi:hypothetical protein
MKNNLGKILLILLLQLTINASTLCDYNFKVSNYKPFVKEAVEITFYVAQKDKSGVMFYDLLPIKNKDFELYLLGNSEDKRSYHDTRATYKYLLFPLKSGKLKLEFKLKVALASDEGVEKFYTGNRDVINPMAAKRVTINIKPLIFDVLPIKEVDLVGDFKLKRSIDKLKLDPYEQLNLSFTLLGHGYEPKLDDILPKIDGVEIFLEKNAENSSFLKNGKIKYNYALLGDQDFKIPKVELKCFSPTKKSYYTLKTKSQIIKVIPAQTKELVDKKDSYPTSAFNWSSLLPFINGLLLFISGFVVAKLDLLRFLKRDKELPKDQKFHNAKNKKSLLKILISSNNIKYKSIIQELESCIYENKKCNLKEIKEKLSNL